MLAKLRLILESRRNILFAVFLFLLIVISGFLAFTLFFKNKVIIDDSRSTYKISYKSSTNTSDFLSSFDWEDNGKIRSLSTLKLIMQDESIPDIQAFNYTYSEAIKVSPLNLPRNLSDITLQIIVDPKNADKLSQKELNYKFLFFTIQALYEKTHVGQSVENKVENINKIAQKFNKANSIPFDLIKKK